jgi:hypothetical protein
LNAAKCGYVAKITDHLDCLQYITELGQRP